MYSVTKQIRGQMDAFSRKERLIAKYILENSEDFLTASIAENADSIGVSQASITKFSKKIGLKGLRSLKVELAKEHTKSEEEVYRLRAKVDANRKSSQGSSKPKSKGKARKTK